MSTHGVQTIVARFLLGWMGAVSVVIAVMSRGIDDEHAHFYRFGPHPDLLLMGFRVDCYEKYAVVIAYCIVNSVMRTLYNDILHAWILNHVQDETKAKTASTVALAYNVTCVTSMYHWFDWLIYMNILLAQIDLVIVEVTTDVAMSLLTTRYYIKKSGLTRAPLIGSSDPLIQRFKDDGQV